MATKATQTISDEAPQFEFVEDEEAQEEAKEPQSPLALRTAYTDLAATVSRVLDQLQWLEARGELDPKYGPSAIDNANRLYSQLLGCGMEERS